MKITKQEEVLIKELRKIRKLFRDKVVKADDIPGDPDWWNDTLLDNVIYYVTDLGVEKTK